MQNTLRALRVAKDTGRVLISRENGRDFYKLYYDKDTQLFKCFYVSAPLGALQEHKTYHEAMSHIPELEWTFEEEIMEKGAWYKTKAGRYFTVWNIDKGNLETRIKFLHDKDSEVMDMIDKMAHVTRIRKSQEVAFLNHGRRPEDWKSGDLYKWEGSVREVESERLPYWDYQQRLAEAELICFVEDRRDYQLYHRGQGN